MADRVNRNVLPDIQNELDTRNKFIGRAGVTNVQIPLKISQKDNVISQTVQANVSMYVSVAEETKGANMSRFLETLMVYESETLSSKVLNRLLKIC